MAKLNENTVNIEKFSRIDLENLGMALQGFLMDCELKKLKEDFRKQNEGKSPKDEDFTPYWKFCLDNINVSYGGK